MIDAGSEDHRISHKTKLRTGDPSESELFWRSVAPINMSPQFE